LENEIEVNGEVYIKKSCCNKMAAKLDGLEYCIVRSTHAGVFAGYIFKRVGQEVEMLNARRIWYWDGANSLSQLAIDGTSKPQNCKFPAEVAQQTILEVIEVIPCTEKAQKSIKEVAIWNK
jgi:hypothetical protein